MSTGWTFSFGRILTRGRGRRQIAATDISVMCRHILVFGDGCLGADYAVIATIVYVCVHLLDRNRSRIALNGHTGGARLHDYIIRVTAS